VAFDDVNNLITFTIDGTEYQAEEDMTWSKWVASDYNIDKFMKEGAFILEPSDRIPVKNVSSVDAIINEGVYYAVNSPI
jgi:hypothetical protein